MWTGGVRNAARNRATSGWPGVAALAFALILAGCRFAHHAGRELSVAFALFPSEAARYHAFAAEFERREQVTVNIIPQAYGDILQAMRVQTVGHGALDLVELDLAMLGEAKRYAMPLDNLISPQARALFSKQSWDAATFDGHIYFVPHRLMWEAMIYNRLKVSNPPATWDELRRFARLHPGKLALKAARYEGAVCDVLPFVWSAGGDECNPLAPETIRALTFLGAIAPDLNDESGVFREMSVLEAQARGSVWIHFNWPFAIGYLQAKGLAPGVDLSAPIPAGPEGMAAPLGGGYLAIPRSAPHPKLAAAFIEYLLTRDAQVRLSRELGWYGSVPPPPGSEAARLYAGYIAMRPYVRARPTVDCYPMVSDRWRRAIRAVLLYDEAPRKAVAEVFDGMIAPVGTNVGRGVCDCAGERQ
jgi:ABC-type glycerol-3-phosphate transport system substrate-binding protein